MSLNKLEQDLLEAGVNALCRIASALETIAKKTPPYEQIEVRGPDRTVEFSPKVLERIRDTRPPAVIEMELAAKEQPGGRLPVQEAVIIIRRHTGGGSYDAMKVMRMFANAGHFSMHSDPGYGSEALASWITFPKKP